MIINVKDFDMTIIEALEDLPRKAGNQRTKKRPVYKDAVCAFDIETSYIKELDAACLYIWQFQLDEACTIIGRTWKEFTGFISGINERLGDNIFIVVYVHNLSYEFQFMRSLFSVSPEDVFVVKSRRVLKWICGHIEFRCSYLHCNMGLAAYTHKFGVKHEKLSGEDFDYSKIRYSDTPLTDQELAYCTNDVLGLVEALKAEMKRDNDNLYTIPLTSTGYVRRDVKRVLREWGRNRLQELFPVIEVYKLLREAFRGGNVHANRYFVKNPEFPLPPIENVHSADISSSYPSQQVENKFPMTPFKHVEKSVTYTQLKEHYIQRRGYALIFRMEVSNIKMRDKFNPCPYLSFDKCRSVRGKVLDNGRILSADHIETTVTDIDFIILDKQYNLSDDNVVIKDLYFAAYGYLPDQLRELVKDYYTQKTTLKGIPEQQLYYDKFKNLINACYGCSAQDPAKDNILYIEEPEEGKEIYQNEGLELIDILNDARPTMPYQWGVWTTARARERLQLLIDKVHEAPGSEFVYTDTDSVKYIGEYDLEEVNKELREIAIQNKAYADDIKGQRHYMGIYEYEGMYKRFETLGAKSYVYEDDVGRLHITIAGVPKRAGALELEKMGGFSAYKTGAIFHDGITETRYNDKRQLTDTVIDGHKVELTSNLVIQPNQHQIGFANDYSILLSTLTKDDIEKIRKL